MKKIPYVIIIVCMIAVAGIYYYGKTSKPAKAPAVESSSNSQNQKEISENAKTAAGTPAATSSAPAAKTAAKTTTKSSHATYSSGEGDAFGPDVLVKEVVFDGSRFSPQSVDIKVGDIIIFKNNSSQSFWPASDPHPTHTAYPEFDAKEPIPAGGKFQFQFAKAGTWGYHNHLNPSITGVVNVSK